MANTISNTLVNARGYTLVEVVVATLVLSVGILGVVGMQTESLRAGQGAYAHSRAVFLAQDMLERARANPGGRAASAYDRIDTNAGAPEDPGCAAAPAGCTPAQVAQLDAREWTAHFANIEEAENYRPALPGGRGVLTGAPGGVYTATVSWDERNAARRSVSLSLSAEPELEP